MATGRQSPLFLVMLVVTAFVGLANVVKATTHKLDWEIPNPPNNSTLTTALKKGPPIMVGDTLLFEYRTGSHDVLQVTEADFHACNTMNATKTWTEGPTKVTFDTYGSLWFICGYPGHCGLGQKVKVDVFLGLDGKFLQSPAPAPAPQLWG